ncbi:hypothetical protein PCC8801_3273 [Rippkaea orientalis PCC 8801]|uniref:Uncharacterized protein n=1 Tax=Rippkaea orientalis (strain PCC 8801 / RF-1) TaxID=41431 RepID=B7JYE4_RIPO1|nr:hypothetical protein [Rippkaea orientalis]ACK67246.1 hypothetical protein PCC8801_3273 [Rippkaea orientalis PCC 8801]
MSQLVIKDLEFCESEILRNQRIRGSASFFDVKFDFSSLFKIANLSGQAGAGFGVAIALAIGDKIQINIGTGVQ